MRQVICQKIGSPSSFTCLCRGTVIGPHDLNIEYLLSKTAKVWLSVNISDSHFQMIAEGNNAIHFEVIAFQRRGFYD